MAPVPPEVADIISSKKARYGRYVDTKQFHRCEEFALPDAHFQFFGTNGSILTVGKTPLEFASAKAFAEFFSKMFAQAETLHMFGPGDFEKIGVDEITAIWALEDQIMFKPFGALAEIRGGGYYYETWQFVDGDWRLKTLRMQRTYQKETILVKLGFFVQTWLGLSLL